MSLFGPKRPCAHCGKKVKKPDDPAAFLCPHCHQPSPWADPTQVKEWEAAEADNKRREEEQRVARQHYAAVLARIGTGDRAAMPEVGSAAQPTGYSPAEIQALALQTFTQYAQVALADDLVTKEEDEYLQALVTSLGLTWQAIYAADRSLVDHLVIGESNAGSLPTLAEPSVILKKGEVAHWQCPASLMKDVPQREFQAGYQGFSFPIGKTGIRYRVGGARGHTVVVGHQLQVADQGSLTITSSRVVFIGAAKTQEFAYSKLVGLDVFTDGVRLHVSNRQAASLFTLPNGELVAALIHAAVNRLALTA